MLGWFRRWLRGWLLSKEHEEKPYLDCLVRGPSGLEQTTYLIKGSQGIALLGVAMGSGPNESWRLIRETQAVDGRRFWLLWRRFNPATVLEWEGGDKVELPD